MGISIYIYKCGQHIMSPMVPGGSVRAASYRKGSFADVKGSCAEIYGSFAALQGSIAEIQGYMGDIYIYIV